MYQVEVLFVSLECLIKQNLLLGGPDVRTYQRNRRKKDSSAAAAMAEMQPALFKAVVTKYQVCAKNSVLSHTILRKTSAGWDQYYPHVTDAVTRLPLVNRLANGRQGPPVA